MAQPVVARDKSEVSEDEMKPEVDDDHVQTTRAKNSATKHLTQRSRSSSKEDALIQHVSSKQSVQSEKTEKTLPIDAPTQLIRKQPEESKRPAKQAKRNLKTELEVLSEEEATPVASDDHKMLFGSKVKPAARQPDKVVAPKTTIAAVGRAEQLQSDLFGPTQVIGA